MLCYMANGYMLEEIAAVRGTKVTTIREQAKKCREKLNARSSIHAVWICRDAINLMTLNDEIG